LHQLKTIRRCPGAVVEFITGVFQLRDPTDVGAFKDGVSAAGFGSPPPLEAPLFLQAKDIINSKIDIVILIATLRIYA